jgi:hypothetical protein
MNDVKRFAQKQMDEDILFFVREMTQTAPVTAESIHGFLANIRRSKATITDVKDRLIYLVGANYLKEDKVWEGGEVIRYTITADGMDLLDGNIPPRNWKP